VKEKIQEPAKYHGVTTNSAVSVEDFEKKLEGEKVESTASGDKAA
jgi:hypothetical protein